MVTIRIYTSKPGTLSEFFIQTGDIITFKNHGLSLSDCTPIELTIEGKLNSEDVKFFRKLCGRGKSLSETNKQCIKILNLSKATFIADDNSYFTTYDLYNYTAYYKTKPFTVTSYMFAYLNVQEVVLPYDIVTIEPNAFTRSSITSIIFPETIKLLQQESLCSCQIETLSINAETILQKSFSCCVFLREIKIGKNVKHINGAFNNNKTLCKVEIDADNEHFKMQDNCLLNSGGNQLVLYVQAQNRTKLIIPDGVERICGGAIQGEAYLTEIVLPNSLRYIGAHAFLRTNVEELHIPVEVISISSGAFPRTLSRLYFYSETPPKIQNARDLIYYKLTTIYVPKNCVERYKQEFKWLADIIVEANYDAQVRIARKEVKNRAFYKKLVEEIKEITPMEIVHHTNMLEQGRFEDEEFLSIWEKNLYYIKWMLRLGAITNISNDVFGYLLKHYPVKRRAINNLKALLTVCKVKRAQKAEEIEYERAQLREYIAEQRRYKDELDEIELANKLFEDMMNEYEAWGNID
jgi:hypothetical protein